MLKKGSAGDGDAAVSESTGGIRDLEHFVDYVVRALVDHPDMIAVFSEPDAKNGGRTIIRVKCDEEDVGKIIGRNGKTISAIRSLVSGAGKRFDANLTVELAE
jgi:predicted RNA-binding protein YlqC (UPF0109 family)